MRQPLFLFIFHIKIVFLFGPVRADIQYIRAFLYEVRDRLPGAGMYH